VLAAAWAVRRQRPAGPRARGVLGLKALEFEGGTSDGDAGGLSRHRISVLWRCRPGQVVEGDELATMAHPFTAAPLGFSVMGRDSLWWGGCAWDSFALPHLPDQGPMLVATTCPACDRAHAWRVDDREPPVGDQVAHFLVPAARMWDDVVYTCGNQRIFCSEECVAIWLNESGHQRGCVLDLPTLWRLAAGWYAGRLERGYVRREPSAAADYLRSVGLSGTFWGLTSG
jgi:Alkylmercury lyase